MSADPPGLAPADGVLIRRFLDGDERAFRLLYRRHAPRLRMLVLRLVRYQDADADDVLQDAWLAACRALRDFRGDARFDSWLSTIALRIARRRMGRLFYDADSTDDMDLAVDTGDRAPLDASIDAERALRLLPDRSRIVFTLHHMEGFSHDEIARELGIAPGTSRAIVSRALAQLRSHYRSEVAS